MMNDLKSALKKGEAARWFRTTKQVFAITLGTERAVPLTLAVHPNDALLLTLSTRRFEIEIEFDWLVADRIQFRRPD